MFFLRFWKNDFPLKETLTLNNVVTHMKSVINKDQKPLLL